MRKCDVIHDYILVHCQNGLIGNVHLRMKVLHNELPAAMQHVEELYNELAHDEQDVPATMHDQVKLTGSTQPCIT